MVALGYDDGTVVVKIGSENPCISMDHAGKIIWAQQMEVQQANLQRLSEEIEDGERLSLVVKVSTVLSSSLLFFPSLLVGLGAHGAVPARAVPQQQRPLCCSGRRRRLRHLHRSRLAPEIFWHRIGFCLGSGPQGAQIQTDLIFLLHLN